MRRSRKLSTVFTLNFYNSATFKLSCCLKNKIIGKTANVYGNIVCRINEGKSPVSYLCCTVMVSLGIFSVLQIKIKVSLALVVI